jgi:hypothetical protein
VSNKLRAVGEKGEVVYKKVKCVKKQIFSRPNCGKVKILYQNSAMLKKQTLGTVAFGGTETRNQVKPTGVHAAS